MCYYRKIKTMMLLMLACLAAKAQLSDGKVYNFVNVGNSSSSMSIISNNNISIAATDTSDYGQLWHATMNDDGSYSLRNLANGRYLRSSNATSVAWTMVKADGLDANCKLGSLSAGSGYTLRATNTTGAYNCMHYASNVGRIVCWESSNPATQWTMNVVDINESELEANWAKLAAIDPEAVTVAGYQTALDNLFSDKACTVLKKSFATEDAVKTDTDYLALPEALQQMVLKVYTANWTEDNCDSIKPDWDTNYAKKYRVQLYEPYNEPEAAAKALGLKAHTNLNNPTGIFSNAKEALYVMVEGTVAEGASLCLSSYTGHGKPGGYAEGIQLHEGLNVIPSFANSTNYCINYVVHTFDTSNGKRGNKAKARKLSDYDDLKIHIEGGYINGYYNKVGDTLYTPDKAADWDYIEARATQTDVTVLGKYMTLQFPLHDVEGCKGMAYYLNDRVSIEKVIDEWDDVMLWERLVLGVLDEATTKAEALKSPYSDKDYVFEYTGNDVGDYASGYSDYYNVHGLSFGVGGSSFMYAGWDHCGYHFNTLSGIMQSMPTDAGSHWGPAHEIGHQHQGILNMRGLTEVTNNLFANVVLWYYGESTSRYNGSDGALSNVLAQYTTEGTDFFSNNIWALTHMYYKMFLYYHVLGHNPKFYPVLFEMLRQDPMVIQYNQSGATSLLHFYKKCCLASGDDLTEFFRAYGCFEVMNNRNVGDYSSAVYTMTQDDIDAAIAEVKALGYEENIAVLFINDGTGESIMSHKGDTLTFYSGSTVCAEVGNYATFGDTIQTSYTYAVSGNTITMDGTGGVGFIIYDTDSVLIGFSDKKSFAIADDVAASLALNQLQIAVVNADNTLTEAVNVMDTDNTDAKRALLGKQLELVEEILALSDTTGCKVGYYDTSALFELQPIYDVAKRFYDNENAAYYDDAYNAVYQAYVEVKNNENARISIVEGNAYRLVNKAYPNLSMSINGSNIIIGETTADNDAQLWYFEAATNEGTYYVKNKSTGTYAEAISTSVPLEGSATTTSEATAYRLSDMGNGLWTLDSNKSMHCAATQGYKVVGWSPSAVASQWYITAIETGETYELQELANRRHTETTSISITYLSADEAAAIDDAVIYNLYGQRQRKITVPGIYIINGKKTYVK